MEDPPTIKADECRAFLNKFSSLLLASSDAVGVPEISYSPFVMEDESFFILVSELSKHTGNLRERSRVSAMLIEDEDDAANIYTRRRLILHCAIKEHRREGKRWSELLPLFKSEFGDIVTIIKTLTDFVLFELQPLDGRWITGFGAAFTFDRLDFSNAEHVGPTQLRGQ
jgi:putative heme iron utilization protein